jgi:hypothetical protein
VSTRKRMKQTFEIPLFDTFVGSSMLPPCTASSTSKKLGPYAHRYSCIL